MGYRLAICMTVGLAVLLVAPAPALAWGVGVHLQVGTFVLEHADLLVAPLQGLLPLFRSDFLYGCISADIILGKKYTHHLEHCHGWRIGERLLQAAPTDPLQAFAWGYIAHLAADTVAHGYFVPTKMVRTYNTSLHKHAYWEMRMEATVPDAIWEVAKEVARRTYPAHDALLRANLSNTVFSFGTNKRLFDSMLLINRLKQWHRALKTLERRSRYDIGAAERQDYLVLAQEAALSVLNNLERSPYRQADPTGERAIRAAKVLRRNLRHLWLNGKLDAEDARRYVESFRLTFRRGLTRPEEILGLLHDEERRYPRERNRATRSRI